MDKKKFMEKIEKEADYTERNGKAWFSAKTVFEIIDWAKKIQGLDRLTAEQIEKKLEFLRYCPKEHKKRRLKNELHSM